MSTRGPAAADTAASDLSCRTRLLPEGPTRGAVYEGNVSHRRPGHDGHRFDQLVRMVMVDLDGVDELCRVHPLWSARHPAPVWFRRRDFLGDPAVPLGTAVRDLVEQRTGHRPTGPVTLLTNPRTWGWMFNPVSFYFVYDGSRDRVEHLVAEVTNTPWLERHCYVVGPPGVHEFPKELHVSPFLGMDQLYRLDYTDPDEKLEVRFTVSGPDGPVLFAGVSLVRHVADRRSLGKMVWAPGGGPAGVSMGIYRQALALARKGTPFHAHPRAAAPPAGNHRAGIHRAGIHRRGGSDV